MERESEKNENEIKIKEQRKKYETNLIELEEKFKEVILTGPLIEIVSFILSNRKVRSKN